MNIKDFFNLTPYISELDQFLNNFDQQHPKLSASQVQEKEKYKRIFELRDHFQSTASEKKSRNIL